MKYLLQLDIGCDENRWTWDEFYAERDKFYNSLIKNFPSHEGRIEDFWVKFLIGTPDLAESLIKIAEDNSYIYSIGVFINYTAKEIREARFVPFLVDSNDVDCNVDAEPLNEYRVRLCDTCGRVDDSKVPNPLYIDKKVMKRYEDIYNGSLVKILSFKAFELLREDIEKWIDFGNVRIIDKNGKITGSKHEYVWIWPKIQIGPFVSAEISKKCIKCRRPTQIYKKRQKDIFLENKEIVKTFTDTKAPIVRSGNWFGQITNEYPYHKRLYEYFISGELHEKIRKMNLKGFVEADNVIHAADEPYEWDPLKDRY